MSLQQHFGTDSTKLDDGIWIELCTNADKTVCRFLISRMGAGNPRFERVQAKLARQFATIERKPVDQRRRATVEALFETVVLDWEHVVDFSGDRNGDSGLSFLEFNKNNFVWLLTELPDLIDLITAEAGEITNFQAVANEETVKN